MGANLLLRGASSKPEKDNHGKVDHHNNHHDEHHSKGGAHSHSHEHDHHDEHHHDHHHDGKWYEIFHADTTVPVYNMFGERLDQKHERRFYEIPIYATIIASVVTVFGLLYAFPFEDKGEWAEEEIRIRKSVQLGRSEQELSKRKEMIKKFLEIKNAHSVQPLHLTEVKKQSAWLVTDFDRLVDQKSIEMLLTLKGNPVTDPLKEFKIVQEANTISQNLELRKERNKELDLLHYLLFVGERDLSNSFKINSSLKRDLYFNNYLRRDLQLGISNDDFKEDDEKRNGELLLQESIQFAEEFDSVLKNRISKSAASNKKFSVISI